jgi:hypothetical protein
MKIAKVLLEFAAAAALAFVVTALVSWLWNLSAHGAGTVDWGTAVRMSIILGCIATWTIARGNKKA